ncbi:BH0509 family protein [Alkalihalobacterium chitinilyticum]|uniref:BH0509 family protein n=1 Tax=Alkalihalobacterium chitinilyticum TaxID=2980103 RepID=A0ABT5VFQ6_9BACI|nr:BH0509 family protein [Alkalihalobacterium chitinilyticum]MDE5413547.1 BH0509 family protein [Alkalihalobacterium chitinilyticum]
MSRKERENMIRYIEMVKGLEKQTMSHMTDQDIEYIYETTYMRHESE